MLLLPVGIVSHVADAEITQCVCAILQTSDDDVGSTAEVQVFQSKIAFTCHDGLQITC